MPLGLGLSEGLGHVVPERADLDHGTDLRAGFMEHALLASTPARRAGPEAALPWGRSDWLGLE